MGSSLDKYKNGNDFKNVSAAASWDSASWDADDVAAASATYDYDASYDAPPAAASEEAEDRRRRREEEGR